MLYDIKIYFLLFLIYSFMGWCVEVTYCSIETRKFVNRGFLLATYCPIYGCGAVLITLLLNRFVDLPILLFVMAVLLCGVLEYLTSYIMEKIFHLRWWDYSKNKFNINGRVCLNTLIPFGILGLIIMYLTNPFFLDKLYKLSEQNLSILFYVFLSLIVIDIIISSTTIFGIRNTANKINTENVEDNTEEITKKIKEILMGKSFVQRRLVNAYPKLQAIKIRVKEKIDKTKDEIGKQIDKTKNQIEKQKEKIDYKVGNAKKKISKKVRSIKIRKNK